MLLDENIAEGLIFFCLWLEIYDKAFYLSMILNCYLIKGSNLSFLFKFQLKIFLALAKLLKVLFSSAISSGGSDIKVGCLSLQYLLLISLIF